VYGPTRRRGCKTCKRIITNQESRYSYRAGSLTFSKSGAVFLAIGRRHCEKTSGVGTIIAAAIGSAAHSVLFLRRASLLIVPLNPFPNLHVPTRLHLLCPSLQQWHVLQVVDHAADWDWKLQMCGLEGRLEGMTQTVAANQIMRLTAMQTSVVRSLAEPRRTLYWKGAPPRVASTPKDHGMI